MVPATALPEAGIAPVTDPVTYNVKPLPVAKIELLGETADPIVPRLESDKVHPPKLFPDTIYVLDPFIYIPMDKAGVPLVIRRRLLLTYAPAIETFAPPIKPVKVTVDGILEPVISMFVGFVICPSN